MAPHVIEPRALREAAVEPERERGAGQDEPPVSGDDDEGLPAARVIAAGAAADAVKDYLKQIGRVRLLTAGQEVELARRYTGRGMLALVQRQLLQDLGREPAPA